jgi:hypothetical protein
MSSGRSFVPSRVWAVIASATVTVSVIAPAADAAVPSCRVTNLTTQQVYEGTGSNLQTAIGQASSGTRLRIRGVCIGTFSIGKSLTLTGWPTAAFPSPTLDGNDAGTVLRVNAGSVVVDDLRITDGIADCGGGIDNREPGTVHLTGWSSVSGNRASFNGGGVLNAGTFTLNDTSAVSGNVGQGAGAGIYNAGGHLVLRESSSVFGNSAEDLGNGGGIYNEGTVALRGSSTVSDNFAGGGGGIFNAGAATAQLHGYSSLSGNEAFFGGGGITNRGTVGLSDRSAVFENAAITDYSQGGGIANFGRTTLDDSSSVWGNVAGDSGGGENVVGGGIYNEGTLTLRNDSSVRRNRTLSNGSGGGIANLGTLTMNGTSSVRRNIATDADGGGIFMTNTVARVTMNGQSSVRRNTAINGLGGGIFRRFGTLIGAVAGGNVSDNIPDDIAP